MPRRKNGKSKKHIDNISKKADKDLRKAQASYNKVSSKLDHQLGKAQQVQDAFLKHDFSNVSSTAVDSLMEQMQDEVRLGRNLKKSGIVLENSTPETRSLDEEAEFLAQKYMDEARLDRNLEKRGYDPKTLKKNANHPDYVKKQQGQPRGKVVRQNSKRMLSAAESADLAKHLTVVTSSTSNKTEVLAHAREALNLLSALKKRHPSDSFDNAKYQSRLKNLEATVRNKVQQINSTQPPRGPAKR